MGRHIEQMKLQLENKIFKNTGFQTIYNKFFKSVGK